MTAVLVGSALALAVVAWAGLRTAQPTAGRSGFGAFGAGAKEALAVEGGVLAAVLLLLGVPLLILAVVIGVVGGGLSLVMALVGSSTMLGGARAVPLGLSGLAALALAAVAAGISALCGGRAMLDQQRRFWRERTAEQD